MRLWLNTRGADQELGGIWGKKKAGYKLGSTWRNRLALFSCFSKGPRARLSHLSKSFCAAADTFKFAMSGLGESMLIDLNDAHVRPTQVFEHLRLSHCKKWKDTKACISRVSFASLSCLSSLNASLSCLSHL